MLAFGLIGVVLLGSTVEVSSIFKGLKKLVRHIVKPFKKFGKVVGKPVVKILGHKKVKKGYKSFVQQVKHKKVIFTPDSYKVESITPCPDGNHERIPAEEPVKMQFDGGKEVIVPYEYCKKCGETFFSDAAVKDEL